MPRAIFITGGTGYMGSRVIPLLRERGHRVVALVRPGSERKLPQGCDVVRGNALDGGSYASSIGSCDTFVQLTGVARPSPAKAREFVSIDRKSAMEAIRVAVGANIQHFVYLSVAHPAPMMHAYIEPRSACEDALRASGLNATILRPWYVLGPGHRWPYVLIPFYRIAELIPSKREGALRLGLVTLRQMLNALVAAVENPTRGVKVVEVPEIRTAPSARDRERGLRGAP
jgi:uncharacterized protein YbjT (DUF2867 family)